MDEFTDSRLHGSRPFQSSRSKHASPKRPFGLVACELATSVSCRSAGGGLRSLSFIVTVGGPRVRSSFGAIGFP